MIDLAPCRQRPLLVALAWTFLDILLSLELFWVTDVDDWKCRPKPNSNTPPHTHTFCWLETKKLVRFLQYLISWMFYHFSQNHILFYCLFAVVGIFFYLNISEMCHVPILGLRYLIDNSSTDIYDLFKHTFNLQDPFYLSTIIPGTGCCWTHSLVLVSS